MKKIHVLEPPMAFISFSKLKSFNGFRSRMLKFKRLVMSVRDALAGDVSASIMTGMHPVFSAEANLFITSGACMSGRLGRNNMISGASAEAFVIPSRPV